MTACPKGTLDCRFVHIFAAVSAYFMLPPEGRRSEGSSARNLFNADSRS